MRKGSVILIISETQAVRQHITLLSLWFYVERVVNGSSPMRTSLLAVCVRTHRKKEKKERKKEKAGGG